MLSEDPAEVPAQTQAVDPDASLSPERLFEKHLPLAKTVARSVSRGQSRAKTHRLEHGELEQAARIALFNCAKTWKKRGTFENLAAFVMRRACRKVYADLTREIEAQSKCLPLEHAEETHAPELACEAEDENFVADTLSLLPEVEALIVRETVIHGKSCAEVARELSMRAEAVRELKAAALAKLKGHLDIA